MSETPYFDAYMRGDRSNDFFYKKLIKEIDNDPITARYYRTHFITDRDYFEEDWRFVDWRISILSAILFEITFI